MNTHVRKMILESAQMLSTVNRLNGLEEGYLPAYTTHKCVRWVMESELNWKYLKYLALYLGREAVYRGYSYHDSLRVIKNLSVPNLPIKDRITTPKLSMPTKYMTDDVIESYRKYYIGDKQHLAEWGIRGKPYWYILK
jgi:hypothetical protein